MEGSDQSDIISPLTARNWLVGTDRAVIEDGNIVVNREDTSHLTKAALFIAHSVMPMTLNEAYEHVNPDHPFVGHTLVRTAQGINNRYNYQTE